MTTVSRREFVTVLAVAGGGLLLGYRGEGGPRGLAMAATASAADASSPGVAPNAFIRIGADGSITLIMPQAEMGQGTHTSMPMLLAEELEVAPEQVRLEHAPPDNTLYANPFFGEQIPALRPPCGRFTSRCAAPGRRRAPCSWPQRQHPGMSIQRRAGRGRAL